MRGSLCFNPRSHVGSDDRPSLCPGTRKVSIHAPTWGATHQTRNCKDYLGFQSTLPRGERHSAIPFLPEAKSFNPRSHVGSDLDGWGNAYAVIVSIHAPTWGATYIFIEDLRLTGFNPRSHVGSDGASHHILRFLVSFNPRSHVGSDLYCPITDLVFFKFQSTLPRGERHLSADILSASLKVSIHAPTWGATYPCSVCWAAIEFQSTLPRGERPHEITGTIAGKLFQSTLPRGERRLLCHSSHPSVSFNPRSHVGSDLELFSEICSVEFQSTLPRGERQVHRTTY